ncbi:protein associated with topo II related - 1 [Brevipalpus obovatus]|uniref:protein associated with topo II related - 1 n=1 Tax=Brevipalpus obovatus TaxID=246614 RepID=UPI003D9EBE20
MDPRVVSRVPALSDDQIANMLVNENGVQLNPELMSRLNVTPQLIAKLLVAICEHNGGGTRLVHDRASMIRSPGKVIQPGYQSPSVASQRCDDIDTLANLCRQFLPSQSPLTDILDAINSDCRVNINNYDDGSPAFNRFWQFCSNLRKTEKQENAHSVTEAMERLKLGNGREVPVSPASSVSSTVIKRPMRVDELEAMMFNSPSSPPRNSDGSKTETNGGWSPFSTGMDNFIPKIEPAPKPTLPTFVNAPPGFGGQNSFPRRNFNTKRRPGYKDPRERDFSFSNTDEYANLMTQQDISWLLKIQKRQLDFEDPYKEDFYFTSYCSRQLAAATLAKKLTGVDVKNSPTLIVPERNRDKNSKEEYKPTNYEGSLGKLQVCNVKCPRKLLDLAVNQSTEVVECRNINRPVTPIGRAELNAFRRTLLEIERLYLTMLDIDEEDKRMGALPEEAKKPHQEKREELSLKLFRGIYDERHKRINVKVSKVRKGFALIIRSLLVFTENERKVLIVESLIDNHLNVIAAQQEKSSWGQMDFLEVILDTVSELNDPRLPDTESIVKKMNEVSKSSNHGAK